MSNPATVIVKKSNIRGGILGFMTGISIASLASFVYLFDNYKSENEVLVASVLNLQTAVDKLKMEFKRLDAIEKDLNLVKENYTVKSEFKDAKTEFTKQMNALSIAQLELKTKIWERG